MNRSSRLTSVAIATFVSFPVAGARAESPEHPQGTYRFGEGMEDNAFFLQKAPTKSQTVQGRLGTIDVKLIILDKDCPPAGAQSSAGNSIVAYRCRARASVPLCGRKTGEAGYVDLVKGYWENPTQYRQETDKNRRERFTATCSVDHVLDDDEWKEPTGSLAKCVELWHMNSEWRKLTACIHMARAAYAGDKSYTCPGTKVDAWDADKTQHHAGCTMIHDEGKHTEKQGLLCSMWFEAEWDEQGAICINHLRWQKLPSPVQRSFGNELGTLTFPDRPELHVNCREEVLVEEKANLSAPPVTGSGKALVINRSELHLYRPRADTRSGRSPAGAGMPASYQQPPKAVECGSHETATHPSGNRIRWDKEECLQLCQ